MDAIISLLHRYLRLGHTNTHTDTHTVPHLRASSYCFTVLHSIPSPASLFLIGHWAVEPHVPSYVIGSFEP